MKIAVIGSGKMGGTLGKLWTEKGHKIMFSSRNPQSVAMQYLLKEAGENASVGTVKEALQYGDIILLALPPSSVDNFLEEAGDLQNKVLINVTNRMDGKSAGMEVVRLAKNARVVRAFNTIPWEVLSKPRYNGINSSAFLIGDDTEAKAIVGRLCTDINFDPVDAGTNEHIVSLETALGLLWKIFSPQLGRDYGIKILRRNT